MTTSAPQAASVPWGIDFVHLSILTRSIGASYLASLDPDWTGDAVGEPSPWQHFSDQGRTHHVGTMPARHVLTAHRDVGQAKVMWVLQGSKADARNLQVRWNPSVQKYGHSGRLIGQSELRGLVGQVLSDVLGHVRIVNTATDVKVTRLDLTKDFFGPADVLADLMRSRLPGLPSSCRVFMGPLGPETIYWDQPRKVVMKVYDKAAQMKAKGYPVPAHLEGSGWLRAEVKLSNEVLSDPVPLRLASLATANLDALALAAWNRTKVGEPMIASRDDFLLAVTQLGLSDREAFSFVGWYMLDGYFGVGQPSSATLAKYRRILRSLGPVDASVKAALRASGPQYSYRLDIDSSSVLRQRISA